ncbi:MAG: putative bifunctional diguanylate cyclase/phosphodiesterase, partial [Sulfuricella sp.]
HNRWLAIVCLDLKGFKNFNDTLGHETGDLLIKAAAERLAGCLRPGDTLARFGGDDFCAMLADLARSEDVAHATRTILDGFAQPLHAGGRELRLPVTLGISLYPADGTDAEMLLEDADIAMHRARERGDDYQYYSAEMTATAAERLAMENDLRNALERGEFLLHYQPQTSLASGAITGVEALVRWQHPRLGLVPPLKFIPLAEETGLIVPLGEWVLRQACGQARAWHEAGLPALRVAVNLSARQFRQPDIDKTIGRALAETGLAPHRLELELTESILIQEPEAVADTLARLARHGVQISIDDFGTGYSSLAYLKRLPIDVLKIDCGFVRDITTDPDDAAIVRAIITMAHALGIRTVAEGVETKEQQDFLRRQGCDTMQGYYFSRPVPADDIARLLRNSRRPATGERPGDVET